jgi:hypothetical protein
MILTHVRAHDALHLDTLYRLLEERDPDSFISHREMPTREAHAQFVLSRPFRYWYLLKPPAFPEFVGALECLDTNEIGVTIFKGWQRRGFGKLALEQFMRSHQPLPAIPAKRNGSWLANIAIANDTSKSFFAKMGFVKLQEVWKYG